MSEFRRGGSALTAALIGNVFGLNTLAPYTIGLFIKPLQEEFGWSRTTISLGLTLLTLASGVSAPFWGMVADRAGERIIVLIGGVILAIGYGALGNMGNSAWFYWALMTLMALLGTGYSPVAFSRILLPQFERFRGTALGISFLGVGIAAVAAPLALAPIIATYGWRVGYWAIGGAILLSLAPVLGLLALVPRAAPVRLDKQSILLPPPPFIPLLAAIVCVALAVGGAVVHFVPMLMDNGFSPPKAAGFASLLGIALILGRLLTGIAADRLFAPHLAAGLMAIASLGFLVVALMGPQILPAAAIFIGLALGAETDLVAYLASRYFDRRIYGRAYGLLYGGFLAGVAISPLIYAQLHDLFGSYRMGLLASFLALAAAAALFATLPRFPKL